MRPPIGGAATRRVIYLIILLIIILTFQTLFVSASKGYDEVAPISKPVAKAVLVKVTGALVNAPNALWCNFPEWGYGKL